MPWQQHVADIALEVDPATGHLWYRDVDVYVPRQSGKTTLQLPRIVWRARRAPYLGGRQVMLYTAQTGKDALAKWQEDYLEDLKAAPVMRWGRPDALGKEILSSGRQRIRFDGGSTFAPTAGTSSGGHGKSLDDGTIDEFWSQRDNRIMEGWRPAMITRRWAQLWKLSTAGTLSSLPLRSAVDSGRALVESGSTTTRRAYFEWSLPKEFDPEDPASWAMCMPALGLTQPIDAIRHELETMLADPELGMPAFRRAYLNQWADEFDDRPWTLPKPAWSACGDAESRRAAGSGPALALDTTPDREQSAVSMCADRDDGLPMIKVVRDGAGTSWVAGHLRQLVVEKGATCVVLDGASPSHSLLPDIEEEIAGRVPVWVTTAGDMADACGSVYDAVVTEQLRHCDQPQLTGAVRDSKWRIMSGGRKAFDRRLASGNIAPLVSGTLALAGHARYPGGSSILY